MLSKKDILELRTPNSSIIKRKLKKNKNKKTNENPPPGAELAFCAATSNYVTGTQFPSISQLCVPPGWLHYQEGVLLGWQDSLSCSPATPMERKCLLVIHREVPGFTPVWWTWSTCLRLNKPITIARDVFYLVSASTWAGGWNPNCNTVTKSLGGVVPQRKLRVLLLKKEGRMNRPAREVCY